MTLWVAVLALSLGMSTASAEVTDKHREVVQETFDRLIAAVDKPERWDVWPPTLEVVDSPEIQATAFPSQTAEGYTPHVEVYVGLVETIAEFDPDVLAFVVGHEIGHLIYFHSKERQERNEKFGSVKISTALAAAQWDQELEADFYGMQLALKAGFSHRGIRRALLGMSQKASDYCAFEGLQATHPSWDLRASFLQQDDVQRELWRSMVAFKNGVLFLETENYVHAEFCFRQVTDEFPDCYE